MNYSLSRATLWNLAGYLYLLVASLVSTPIIIHALGLATFSHYVLIIATITLASSIDLGLSSAVVRQLSRANRQGHALIWSTSLVLFLLTGLLAAIISTIVIMTFESSSHILLLVFTLTLTSHVLSHFLTLPQAHGRFDLFNLKTFIVGTANTLLVALTVYFGYGIELILIVQLLSYLLVILLLATYASRYYPRLSLKLSPTHARTLLAFGLKNQVGKIVGQLGAQYAKFLLAPVSALSVTAYSVGQGIVLKLAGGITQLSTALYPKSSRVAKSPKLRLLYHRLQRFLFLLGIMGIMLYTLLGLPFLTWWLKEPVLVNGVHSVMRILVWYLAILILTPLPSTILDSHNRPGMTSLFTTLTIGLEIILALSLLSRYGLLAPPIAALISITLTTPFLLFSTERVLQK